jgi:hypothetical protein
MRNKRVLVGIVIVLAFFGYLLWSTLASQRSACRVCVAYKGRQNCATASAASMAEAKRNAQSTACGILVAGMNDAIACGNASPVAAQCMTAAR